MTADIVVRMLADAGVRNVFAAPPSAGVCAEPLVVGEGAAERPQETCGGRRSGRDCVCTVCRTDARAAREAAFECERAVREAHWEGEPDGFGMRVCNIETGVPEPCGRDRSGRHLWHFTIHFTISREE